MPTSAESSQVAAAQAPVAEEPDADVAPAAQAGQRRIRDYFRYQALPWWICFIVGTFLLTKLQIVYNDSPCAVLGTQSPVTMKDVNKAFRTISLCTHPDRLRGRLKREATAAEERRGEIMFKRASDAKDDLANVLKGRQKKVACYQGELELALIGFFAQVGVAASGLGIGDYATFCMDIFWRIMTLLWLMFLLRIVKQFFVYLWRMGIMRMVLAPVTTMIIGPIPTVLHFIFLPFIRCFVFFRSDLLRHIRPMLVRSTDADGGEGAEDVNGSDKKTDAEPEKPITAAMKAAAARTQELPNRGIRQRKKKETDEEKKQKTEELLAGGRAQSQISTSDPDAVVEAERPGDPMPEGVWNCVTWRVGEPVKAR